MAADWAIQLFNSSAKPWRACSSCGQVGQEAELRNRHEQKARK